MRKQEETSFLTLKHHLLFGLPNCICSRTAHFTGRFFSGAGIKRVFEHNNCMSSRGIRFWCVTCMPMVVFVGLLAAAHGCTALTARRLLQPPLHALRCCSRDMDCCILLPFGADALCMGSGWWGQSGGCWFPSNSCQHRIHAALQGERSVGSTEILHGLMASLENSIWGSYCQPLDFPLSPHSASLSHVEWPSCLRRLQCHHRHILSSLRAELTRLVCHTLSPCWIEDVFPTPQAVKEQQAAWDELYSINAVLTALAAQTTIS